MSAADNKQGEIEAAAERFEQYEAGVPMKAIYGTDTTKWTELFSEDTKTLARAYIARLAADRLEREERERPIDMEFVRPLGIVDMVSWSFRGRYHFVGPIGFDVPDSMTRGQLLDLLAALGVERKGGDT